MNYVIVDLTSRYYLALNATPTAPYLLREQAIHATRFENRDDAVAALERANEALTGKYRNLELAIKPASEKSRRTTQRISSFYDTNRNPRTHGSRHASSDVADRFNDALAHNRKYARDMS